MIGAWRPDGVSKQIVNVGRMGLEPMTDGL